MDLTALSTDELQAIAAWLPLADLAALRVAGIRIPLSTMENWARTMLSAANPLPLPFLRSTAAAMEHARIRDLMGALALRNLHGSIDATLQLAACTHTLTLIDDSMVMDALLAGALAWLATQATAAGPVESELMTKWANLAMKTTQQTSPRLATAAVGLVGCLQARNESFWYETELAPEGGLEGIPLHLDTPAVPRGVMAAIACSYGCGFSVQHSSHAAPVIALCLSRTDDPLLQQNAMCAHLAFAENHSMAQCSTLVRAVAQSVLDPTGPGPQFNFATTAARVVLGLPLDNVA